MTTIERVQATTAVVPLSQATAFSSRLVTERQYALVRVVGDDGVAGIGFCYGGNRAGALATQAVLDLLGPVVLGSDAHHVGGTWQRMYDEALLHGRTGTVMRALSALDIALWDRNARAAGLPLHKYLGARADHVDAYASGGYYRDDEGPDQLADELRGYVDAGFDAVKIKVGRLDARAELDRLAAAREAIGPDVLLLLDANNAFRDLPTAIRTLRSWERFDPYLIEEPFSPDDILNHARLAEATTVLVATGEIEAGRWRTRELLDAGGAVVFQQDAAVCGGISELRRIAHVVETYGLQVWPHWFHDLHAPLVAGFAAGSRVEYFPDAGVLNFRTLLDRQLELTRDGGLRLHDRPGLGFDLDEQALRAHAPDGWSEVARR